MVASNALKLAIAFAAGLVPTFCAAWAIEDDAAAAARIPAAIAEQPRPAAMQGRYECSDARGTFTAKLELADSHAEDELRVVVDGTLNGHQVSESGVRGVRVARSSALGFFDSMSADGRERIAPATWNTLVPTDEGRMVWQRGALVVACERTAETIEL